MRAWLAQAVDLLQVPGLKQLPGLRALRRLVFQDSPLRRRSPRLVRESLAGTKCFCSALFGAFEQG